MSTKQLTTGITIYVVVGHAVFVGLMVVMFLQAGHAPREYLEWLQSAWGSILVLYTVILFLIHITIVPKVIPRKQLFLDPDEWLGPSYMIRSLAFSVPVLSLVGLTMFNDATREVQSDEFTQRMRREAESFFKDLGEFLYATEVSTVRQHFENHIDLSDPDGNIRGIFEAHGIDSEDPEERAWFVYSLTSLDAVGRTLIENVNDEAKRLQLRRRSIELWYYTTYQDHQEAKKAAELILEQG